jgi:hypothetical protein
MCDCVVIYMGGSSQGSWIRPGPSPPLLYSLPCALHPTSPPPSSLSEDSTQPLSPLARTQVRSTNQPTQVLDDEPSPSCSSLDLHLSDAISLSSSQENCMYDDYNALPETILMRTIPDGEISSQNPPDSLISKIRHTQSSSSRSRIGSSSSENKEPQPPLPLHLSNSPIPSNPNPPKNSRKKHLSQSTSSKRRRTTISSPVSTVRLFNSITFLLTGFSGSSQAEDRAAIVQAIRSLGGHISADDSVAACTNLHDDADLLARIVVTNGHRPAWSAKIFYTLLRGNPSSSSSSFSRNLSLISSFLPKFGCFLAEIHLF